MSDRYSVCPPKTISGKARKGNTMNRMSTISQARPVMVLLGLLNVDLFLQAISNQRSGVSFYHCARTLAKDSRRRSDD